MDVFLSFPSQAKRRRMLLLSFLRLRPWLARERDRLPGISGTLQTFLAVAAGPCGGAAASALPFPPHFVPGQDERLSPLLRRRRRGIVDPEKAAGRWEL